MGKNDWPDGLTHWMRMAYGHCRKKEEASGNTINVLELWKNKDKQFKLGIYRQWVPCCMLVQNFNTGMWQGKVTICFCRHYQVLSTA